MLGSIHRGSSRQNIEAESAKVAHNSLPNNDDSSLEVRREVKPGFDLVRIVSSREAPVLMLHLLVQGPCSFQLVDQDKR